MRTEAGPSIGARGGAPSSTSIGRGESSTTLSRSTITSRGGIEKAFGKAQTFTTTTNKFSSEIKSSLKLGNLTPTAPVNEGPARLSSFRPLEIRPTPIQKNTKPIKILSQSDVQHAFAVNRKSVVESTKSYMQTPTQKVIESRTDTDKATTELAKKVINRTAAQPKHLGEPMSQIVHSDPEFVKLKKTVEKARETYINSEIPIHKRRMRPVQINHSQQLEKPKQTVSPPGRLRTRMRIDSKEEEERRKKLYHRTDLERKAQLEWNKIKPEVQAKRKADVQIINNVAYSISEHFRTDRNSIRPITLTKVDSGIKLKIEKKLSSQVSPVIDISKKQKNIFIPKTNPGNIASTEKLSTINSLNPNGKKDNEKKHEVDPNANQARIKEIAKAKKAVEINSKANDTEPTWNEVANLLPKAPDDSMISELVQGKKRDGSYTELRNTLSKMGRLSNGKLPYMLVRLLPAVRVRPTTTDPVTDNDVKRVELG